VGLRVCAFVCVHTCTCTHAMSLYACAYACLCLRACVRVGVCVFLSYLPYVPRNLTSANGLSPTTSGVLSVCMSVCMCVCSGACLHLCMYISRTHTTHAYTHIHTHTHTHTSHYNVFLHYSSSTKSLSKLGRIIRITQTNQHLRVRSTILCTSALFSFVLSFFVCAHVCIRVEFCLFSFDLLAGGCFP